MKKIISVFITAIFISTSFTAHAQKTAEQENILNKSADISENEEIDKKTGFPIIKAKPFVNFNEGFSYSLITRLEKQEETNNFVWQDHLVGGFFEIQTFNMKPIDSILRIAAYYPFFHTFNGMEQPAKQTILYAFDAFYGPMLKADMWKYIRFNFAAGPHYMYQISDQYHLNYLGLGLLVGLELPVAKRWTVINNGLMSVDYANLGTNRVIQPFDFSWNYQLEIGVRYSKKNKNKYTYIHKIEKTKTAEVDDIQEIEEENFETNEAAI